MAIIKCRYCGGQVSDKARVCPNCGEKLIEEPVVETPKCVECGCEIPAGVSACPKCGCPIEASESIKENEPQKVEITKITMSAEKAKKIKKYSIISVAVVAVIVVIAIIVSSGRAKKAAEMYAVNFDSCIQEMFYGAASAESTGGLIHDVWYNTINKKTNAKTDKYTKTKYGGFNKDFNDSLSNLFSDTEFKIKINDIKENQKQVASLMKKLKNPPEEYTDAYDALKNLYEAYCDITECAVNPSGSLSSYTSDFNAADSDFIKYYKAVAVYQ